MSNWSEWEKEFKDTMKSSLKSGNLSGLDKMIKQTVEMATEEVEVQIAKSKEIFKEKRETEKKTFGTGQNGNSFSAVQVPMRRESLNGYFQKKGIILAVLGNICGGIGIGITCIYLLVRMVFMVSVPMKISTIVGVAWCVFLFGGMLAYGSKRLNLLKRAKKYAKLTIAKKYASIEDLAAHSRKSKKSVIKDLEKMIHNGIFPQGHIDEEKTSFIISSEVYQNYLDMQRAREQALLEEKQKEEQKQKNQEQMKDLDEELFAMIEEGNSCIAKLRKLNDEIEGEVISEKLYKLENLLQEIFEQVRLHPEKRKQMHRFMNYYLPTSLKLVESYAEFDDVKEPGEEIENAKRQIENTLDTINSAFNELLNKLFLDRIYDVTTDAQVLQTVLSKDGLLKEDFGPVK